MATISERPTTLKNVRDKVLFLTRETISTFPDIDVIINDGLATVWDYTHVEPFVIDRLVEHSKAIYDLPNADLINGNAIVGFAYIEYIGSGGVLVRTQLSESYFALPDTTTDEGTPVSYSLMGDDIVLSPIPDGAYPYTLIVGYKRDFAPLVLDADTPEGMSSQEIEAARIYTCYVLKLSDEEYSAADRWKQQYDEAMAKLSYVHPGVYQFESLYGGAS